MNFNSLDVAEDEGYDGRDFVEISKIFVTHDKIFFRLISLDRIYLPPPLH